jgi:UDP-glucose:(heptosyl)LPS alpha-1,3-glucosyltransferase
MSASRHELHLLVLGTGPIGKFQRIARELGLKRRVQFTGRRSDIERCYGAADLFLLPTAYEPFPNVNLEALACGLPVLTSQTAGGADVIEPGANGYLVSSVHAVDEMTDLIDQHFLLSAADRQEMQARCWLTAKDMTMERNVRETIELFEEVLLEKFRV